MLFIGNIIGRIWGFLVVRPMMKKAINDAENSGDFDEYKKAMDSLDKNMEKMLEATERMKKQAEIVKKSMNEKK